ncbi:condensation domain-containing protein [Escherichia coli]
MRGEPTPASPFTPFADVVEEYQQYRESEAWQRDAAFWAEQRHTTAAARVTFSGTFSGAQRFGRYSAPETGIYRRGIPPAGYATFRCAAYRFSPCAGSLVAGAIVQSHGLCSAGFIFMRRLGSAALTASGPVLNVLPFGIIAAQETLPGTGNPTGSTTEKNASSSTLRCRTNCP